MLYHVGNMLYTPNPTLNLPDSVNKCKPWRNRAISTSLYADLNCFVKLWLNGIWTGAPRLSRDFSVLRDLLNKLTVYENPYETGYVRF